MDEELRDELELLKLNLQIITDDICDAQELINSLRKFCESHANNKNLLEVCYISKNLENKFSNIIDKIYAVISNKNNSATVEEILRRLKLAVEKQLINIVDH